MTFVQWTAMIFGAVTAFDAALFLFLLRSAPGERARKARHQAFLAWAPRGR